MSLHNRPYWQQSGPDGPSLFAFPRPTRMVLTLAIFCGVLFLLTAATRRDQSPLFESLALVSGQAHEAWRFITFQFMHAGPGHLLWNMVMLYFFGTPLEQAWGPRRFLAFYLLCGCFAGLCFLVLAAALDGRPSLVGASGGILACLAACAILFPRTLIFFIPIRWVAGFFALLYLLTVMWSGSLSDAAHLGGMIAAAGWVALAPRVGGVYESIARRRGKGAWRRYVRKQAQRQALIDQILQKIHDSGIQSLTRREKKLLSDATRQQRREEQEARSHRGRFLG
jgi:membrane associated rhomboid family serine protease